MVWLANPERYGQMQYRYCGKSGLRLPALSLGLWHNFGHVWRFVFIPGVLRAFLNAFDQVFIGMRSDRTIRGQIRILNVAAREQEAAVFAVGREFRHAQVVHRTFTSIYES